MLYMEKGEGANKVDESEYNPLEGGVSKNDRKAERTH